MLEQISIPLFKLNTNEQSDVLETSIAKHVVILKSISPEYQKTLKETSETIKEIIIKIETDNYYNDVSSKITEQILNGENITSISKMFDLKLELVVDVTKKFTNFDKSEEQFFASLIQSSFNSNKDFLSDLISINDNQSYIINIPNIELPEPKQFDLIESEVSNDWIKEKKIEKMKLDIEENIDNLEYINNIAEKYELITQKDQVSKISESLPFQFINSIFNSKKNNNIQIYYNEKFYIARIDDVLIPNIKTKKIKFH
jgi:hypothetical protein